MQKTRLTGPRVVGMLILLVCAHQGCVYIPVIQGDIFAGLEDELESAEPISTFDGDWISTEYGYAIRIENRIGRVIITNTPLLDEGDVILVMAAVNGPGFTGRHIFTDGTIRDVVGRLLDSDTLFLSDGGLSWTLSRLNSNFAPTAISQVVATPYATPVTITLTGEDPDHGPEPLTFTILTPPPNGQLTGSLPVLTYTPISGFVGTDTFTFNVSDGVDESEAASVTIAVGYDNRPPSVDAGGNTSITLPTNFVDLSGSVSDDGRPYGVLTTTWSVIDGPDGAVFADATAVNTTVTFAQAGTYVLQLAASDGLLTTTDSITVFVRAAAP